MTLRRWAALGASLLLVLGCASMPPQPPDPGITGDRPGRVIVALADRGLDFPGFVVIPGLLSMALYDSITVTITVCGSQARSSGCVVDSVRPSAGTAASAPTGAVRPGGQVTAYLSAIPSDSAAHPGSTGAPAPTDFRPFGTTTRISSTIPGSQPLSDSDASATWTWLVTPDQMGPYTLTVHLTAQHGITNLALPEQTITIPLVVHKPRDASGSSIVDKLFLLALVLCGLVVLTLALFVVASIRRRRRAGGEGQLLEEGDPETLPGRHPPLIR
jgi:hypothetical protein